MGACVCFFAYRIAQAVVTVIIGGVC